MGQPLSRLDTVVVNDQALAHGWSTVVSMPWPLEAGWAQEPLQP
jgi:hypothetical protein